MAFAQSESWTLDNELAVYNGVHRERAHEVGFGDAKIRGDQLFRADAPQAVKRIVAGSAAVGAF